MLLQERKRKEEEEEIQKERTAQAAKIAAMGGTDKTVEELAKMSTQDLEAEQRRLLAFKARSRRTCGHQRPYRRSADSRLHGAGRHRRR